ncbi:DUF1326 domain-containing protein [Aestuariicella hydrocarbonica]|uniref:DUF1326 domain-containing protein n=1 Tax=Pseudomaricurvus hydrocarbonicus TaxID=1470433 RepID=A0A9E5MM45_9GAMM|nr:DUF1326 domain-containing protein [Aestuariicella hydrocarbonica]NHO65435.1 DUF1326 domain-containing protein [Aestuariicella hydrocarbonica]
MISWELNATSFTNCNCDYGCPCQFNALPTHGNCEAIHSMEINSGHFGETDISGLKAVTSLTWPGPIHEGGGKAFIIIDDSATDEQRAALLTIMSGLETEPGATIWNVFAATLDEVLEPVFLPIEFHVDIENCQSHIRVGDQVDMKGSPILNPVTGKEHRAQIHLATGFEYIVAEMGRGTSKSDGPIALSFKDSYGQFNEIHLNNQGIIKH